MDSSFSIRGGIPNDLLRPNRLDYSIIDEPVQDEFPSPLVAPEAVRPPPDEYPLAPQVMLRVPPEAHFPGHTGRIG